MKKYAIFGLMVLACFTVKAQFELTGVRYAGYTTNAVPAGFSILAVPFGGFDTSNFVTNNISLEALISTNGLSIDDRLIVFNEANTNYYYYTLTGTGWSALDVADIGTSSTNFVTIIPGQPLSTIAKAQGYAFWLKTTNATIAQLQGVVNTNAAGITIAAGTSFTLVGNTLPSVLNLNSDSFTNNTWFTAGPPGRGDEIHVVSGNAYIQNVYYGGGWKKITYTTTNVVYSVPSDPIPAGSGMWYLRRGTTPETLTIKGN
jgi:hypothetical protein